MRRALHILLAVAVLWCGSHLGEPAFAHDEVEAHHVHDEANVGGGGGEDPAGSAKAAHAHHHCPVATDQRMDGASAEVFAGETILFALPIVTLHSLSRAPPVEPPVT